MESLAANYGSSDEEGPGPRKEEKKRKYPPPRPPPFPSPKSSSSSLFNSLPRPKISSSSSSIFSSLPPPSSSLFSSLPPAKPEPTNPFHPRPPTDVSLEDEDEIKKRRKKQTLDFSSKPLSSIIPAPKNSLCLAPSSSSSSTRRSTIETASPIDKFEPPVPDQQNHVLHDSTGTSYGGNYESYANYGGEWGYGSAPVEGTIAAEMIGSGRRGRKEIPPSQIVEVRQEELVKNRPREDQVKLTGIAFGPAYQSAASSEKGKPSKLHKRKHQIGALYYDMRQKETELAERRARGLLTKKETQAKYGW